MIAAVILTAGASSRMGTPKANLRIGTTTFINSILARIQECEYQPIYIITGYHHRQIVRAIEDITRYTILRNPHPERGQLSSLQIAIRHLDKAVQGMLVVLVDHPLVKESTYRELFQSAQTKPEAIIIPSINSRNGHPVYFGRKFFPALLRASNTTGAREVVRQNADDVIHLEVSDSGIIRDIDTPEDLIKYNGSLSAS